RTLTTPLALSLARDIYTAANPSELLDTDCYPDPDALMQHLFERSLVLAYPDPTQRHHATSWLAWIAGHMGTNRDLRWWDIPTWASRRQRVIGFELLIGPAIWLTVSLAATLTAATLVGEQAEGWVSMLGSTMVVLLLGWPGTTVDRPHFFTPRWPSRQDLARLPGSLAGGLATAGPLVGSMFGWWFGL